MSIDGKVVFSVIGLEHSHIFEMTKRMIRAGAKLKSVYSDNKKSLKHFSQLYPDCKFCFQDDILKDQQTKLIVCASRPDLRAEIGIKSMLNGKDFLSAKPGILTLKDLEKIKQVQRDTQQIFSICFSERFWSGSTLKAMELVKKGLIGEVVSTTALGPHCIDIVDRPTWFYQPKFSGGILIDLASHQIDQFLVFSGATEISIIHSQVANKAHSSKPGFEDIGELVLSGKKVFGTVRVDWLSPKALGVWGDSRLIIQGTDGYIELRKTIDLDGKSGEEHLFLVNHKGVQYYDCNQAQNLFADALVGDVLNRTELSMPQTHCFYVSEMAIQAQTLAYFDLQS